MGESIGSHHGGLVEKLPAVTGIGPIIFDAIKDLVTVKRI